MAGGWSGVLGRRQGFTTAAAIVLAATLLSKLLALLRDVLVANHYGASDSTDAFFAGMILPLAVATPLGQSMGMAAISVSAETLEKGGADAARRFSHQAFQAALLLALFLGGALALLAEPLLQIVAPGLDPARRGASVTALRWLSIWGAGELLYLVLASLFQSSRSFLAPGICMVLANAGMIAGLMIFTGARHAAALPLSWAAGEGLMIVAFVLAYVAVFRYRPQRLLGSPEMRSVAALMVPLLASAVLLTLYHQFDRVLAAPLEAGSVAALGYAFIVICIPAQFVILPTATAALPFMAEQAQAGRRDELNRSLRGTLDLCIAILVPMTLFTALRAEQLVTLAFRRGAFDAEDTLMTSAALAGLAPAILPLAGLLALSRILYALRAAGVAVACLAGGLALKLILSFLLAGPLGVGGLGLATSGGMLAAWALMVLALRKRLGTPAHGASRAVAIATVACSAAAFGAIEGLGRCGVSLPFVAEGLLFMALYAALYLAAVPGQARALRDRLRSPQLRPEPTRTPESPP